MIQTTIDKMLPVFIRWAKQSRKEGRAGMFSAYSVTLQNRFGDDYAKAIEQMRIAGILSIVANHRFRAGEKGKGRNRVYKINTDVLDTLTTVDTQLDALASSPNLTPEQRDYLAIRARTNLTGLAYCVEGKQGDERVYTDFSNLSKEAKAAFLIDGEPTTSFDIANAFPLFLGRELAEMGKRIEAEYLSECERGTLYDTIAEIANVPREQAKIAINKGLNSPRKLTFGRYQGGWTLHRSIEDQQQAVAWLAFRAAFPKTAVCARKLARSRQTYVMGTRYETRIREYLQRFANQRGIPVLANHDGIFAKQSDAAVMWSLYEIAMTKFGQFKVKMESSYKCSPSATTLISGSDQGNPLAHLFFDIEPVEVPPRLVGG
jgi:hypothetical protein